MIIPSKATCVCRLGAFALAFQKPFSRAKQRAAGSRTAEGASRTVDGSRITSKRNFGALALRRSVLMNNYPRVQYVQCIYEYIKDPAAAEVGDAPSLEVLYLSTSLFPLINNRKPTHPPNQTHQYAAPAIILRLPACATPRFAPSTPINLRACTAEMGRDRSCRAGSLAVVRPSTR